jgi:hypothetical protein
VNVNEAPAVPRVRKGGVALEKAMLYITWLIPVLESFPKSQRFLLGDRLQTLAMDVVECIIEATYSKAPRPILQRANLLLEKQRMWVRVAYNLKHLDARRYEFAARKLDELGQSLGAWSKASAGVVAA